MGAGCCTIGASEKETLRMTLEWESGWASSIARDLMVLRECIRNVCSYGCYSRNLSNSHDGETVDELASRLDSIRVLLSGLVKNLDCSYRDDDEDVLSNLLKSFREAKEQCSGEAPIKVNRYEFRDEALRFLKGVSSTDFLMDYEILCINGNGDYWSRRIRRSPWDAIREIEQSIPALMAKETEGEGNEAKPKKIAFLFEDKDVLETMRDYTLDCGAYHKLHGRTFLQVLSEKYKGCRFYYRLEIASEFTQLRGESSDDGKIRDGRDDVKAN